MKINVFEDASIKYVHIVRVNKKYNDNKFLLKTCQLNMARVNKKS